MTDAELIVKVGQALFGERWQTALAHELSVSSRTVRGWASGEDVPRPMVFANLAHLASQRRNLLNTLASLLRYRAQEAGKVKQSETADDQA
jgi:hypothetical protein